MPKALSERQIEHFRSQGYLCPVDCMTPDEAQGCRDRFEAFERDSGLDVLGDLRSKAHLGFPWMTGIARHPRILDAVEDIIGPDILAFASTVWIKNAADGMFVRKPKTSPYFDIEPKGQVVAWVALGLVLVVFTDVVMRYLFNTSFVFTQGLEWHLFAFIFNTHPA